MTQNVTRKQTTGFIIEKQKSLKCFRQNPFPAEEAYLTWDHLLSNGYRLFHTWNKMFSMKVSLHALDSHPYWAEKL